MTREDELKAELADMASKREVEEERKRDEETKNAYDRCVGHRYIKSDRGNGYLVYRIVENITFQPDTLGGCNVCKILENTILMCRGQDVQSSFEVTEHDMFKHSGFIQVHDYPCSKEEYDRAVTFAKKQISAFQEYFVEFEILKTNQ